MAATAANYAYAPSRCRFGAMIIQAQPPPPTPPRIVRQRVRPDSDPVVISP